MAKESVAEVKLNTLATTDPRRIAAERERRSYIKRLGGLRKNLPADQVKRANSLCEAYGVSVEVGWDDAMGPMGMW